MSLAPTADLDAALADVCRRVEQGLAGSRDETARSVLQAVKTVAQRLHADGDVAALRDLGGLTADLVRRWRHEDLRAREGVTR